MYAPHVLATFRVEALIQYPFAISIEVKVDAARRNDACEVCAQATEERAESLVLVDGVEDLHCFSQVDVGGAWDRSKSMLLRQMVGSVEFAQLSLVEVGLEAGLEDIKRGS